MVRGFVCCNGGLGSGAALTATRSVALRQFGKHVRRLRPEVHHHYRLPLGSTWGEHHDARRAYGHSAQIFQLVASGERRCTVREISVRRWPVEFRNDATRREEAPSGLDPIPCELVPGTGHEDAVREASERIERRRSNRNSGVPYAQLHDCSPRRTLLPA